METEWVEVCPHVTYKIHGDKLTIRADGGGEDDESGFTGKVYSTLPSSLSRVLLIIKRDQPDQFEKTVKHFGHQMLSMHHLNNMCLAVALGAHQYSGLITGAMSAHVLNGANLLAALSQGAEMTKEAKAQIDRDEERLRKLLGEDH